MNKIFILIAIILLSQISYALILHVPDEYPTITEAIEASENGDTVLVAPGEYWEDINPEGKNILITSGQGPDTTIIQGHVFFNSNEDTTCIFRGFTVIGQGRDLYYVTPVIKCTGLGKPKIIGNIIKDNICNGAFGGGIGIPNSNAIVRHNIIENNWAMTYGGGIFANPHDDDSEICYNIIRNNWCGFGIPMSGGWGAGINCNGGQICYNLIYGNEVGGLCPPGDCGTGGGIFVSPCGGLDTSAFTHIYNNTIVSNTSQGLSEDGDGGGIHVIGYEYFDTVIIKNNIIAYNYNGGIASTSSNGRREIIVEFNLFFNNTKYDLRMEDTSETNIFDEDPLFVDTSIHDYNLLPDSPCIDAGDPDSPLDPDSTRADIGAFFYDQSVNIDNPKEPTGPFRFRLHQNYPNPFNAQTTIAYVLPYKATVSLTVFDITGRLVKDILKNEIQETGSYSFIWDGTDNRGKQVSTAIYFYQLQVNEEKQVKSMIVIK